MKIRVDPAWRLSAEHAIRVPMPAGAVWGQMRDLEWFLTRDPLHVRVTRTDPGDPARGWRGARLAISHRVLGLGPDRVGRVLRWREGESLVISDLSRRGVDRAFPHVCSYRVEPDGEGASRLVLGVRGKWTARWVPRTLVRAWVWWVLAQTGARLEREFGALARLRRAGAWPLRR